MLVLTVLGTPWHFQNPGRVPGSITRLCSCTFDLYILIPIPYYFFLQICCFLLTNFRVTYFAKTKIPTPTKKNRISHWRYSLFWCRVMQGNKLKLYPIWPKKLGFFLKIIMVLRWCEIYWNGEKNFCAIRQRRLWKPLCCDLYPELYWNLLWELWDMLCPLTKRKKSVVCLQSQVNKTADCETAADIVQKKTKSSHFFRPSILLPAIVYFFLWKQKLKKNYYSSFL